MNARGMLCAACVLVFVGIGGPQSASALAGEIVRRPTRDSTRPHEDVETVDSEDWNRRLRPVPAGATRTRHYYRVATGAHLTGDAASEALPSDGVVADSGNWSNDPVYSCTPPITNNFLFVPGANRLIADDITTVAIGGCRLESFELVVGGGGDGSGPGFGFEFALYPECPLDGVEPIPGATGSLNFDNDGLHLVLIDFHDSPIPTNRSYYIGLTFDTDDAGWIAGVPPSIGFSENQFHHLFFPCSALLPSPTVFAGFHFVAACRPGEREFLAYNNPNVFGPRLNLDSSNWIVDDIQLIGGIGHDTCILTSYEVAAAGTGTVWNPIPFTISAELRTSCEPGSVIQGTQRTFSAVGDGLAEVAQFEFPDGLELPQGQDLFLAFKYSVPANAIISGEPSLGFTQDTFTFEDGCVDGSGGQIPCVQCQFVFDPGPVGFYANIRCLGNAPLGACCDHVGWSTAGSDLEAGLCRNVKEVDCQGALLRFEAGVKCPGTCSDSFDRCQRDADCPRGQTCELDSPFDPPCGTAACCTPPFPSPQDQGCEDLTKTDCLALFDDLACVDANGVRTMLCEGVGAPCTTDDDCPGNDRCEPKICLNDGECNACADSGDPCVTDGDCAGECSTGVCSIVQTNCTTDDDCVHGGKCIGVPCTSEADCLGTCSATGGSCQSRSDCPRIETCVPSSCEPVEECVISGDTCEPGEGAHQAVWQHGRMCDEGEQNCVRWICRFATGNCDEIHNAPGCNNPTCCDEVCDVDGFCCDIDWDGTCVQRATGADGSTPCAGIAAPNSCFALRECSDDSGLCETTADCNQCMASGLPCMVSDDCRACINTGAPCQMDEDCAGGTCAPSGESCFLSGATCVESAGGPRLLNTCSGWCSQIVRACESDNDCNYCNVNQEIHCDDDDDCPFQQACVELALCSIDNPRTNCETTADCDEAGEECFAKTGALGSIMPVETGSTSPDEIFCCHRDGPGLQALGSVWAKFIATSTSAELSTCSSNGADATDSIIEVYRTEFDRECSDTGAPCVEDGDCDSNLCERSNRLACETRMPIACNDNILVGCADPNNSKVCVTNLEIGATYLVQVAAMTVDALDKYSLKLQSPCPGNIPTPPSNDHCEDAIVVFEGSWAYNLTNATMDCPYVGFDCLPPSGDPYNPYTMTNDVWFDYFVTQNGLVTIQTCEGSPQTTPDTTLVVYEGFDCPVTRQRQVLFGCSDDADDSDCGGGSAVTFNVLVNQSYRIRIGGKEGSEPFGNLSIDVVPDCQPNTREDVLDIDCGAGNACRACSISGLPCITSIECPVGEFCSGQLIAGSGDCNGNMRPDECDIAFLIELDCNDNGRPDSCDIACGGGNACGYCSVIGTLCTVDGDCPSGETCNAPMLAGSDDVDMNGEPDECVPPSTFGSRRSVSKSRPPLRRAR